MRLTHAFNEIPYVDGPFRIDEVTMNTNRVEEQMQFARLDLRKGAIAVSEIFYSIQGEGTNVGKPAVFLRTFYCNLTCRWCDTKYTWLNQNQAKANIDYTTWAPEDLARSVLGYGCKHLVITGGEPMLQQRELEVLLQNIKDNGVYVEVETNGTIPPTLKMLDLVDQFNVSLKTFNSGVESKVRIKEKSISAFVKAGTAWFKFVICEPKDIDEVEDLLMRFHLPRDRVILMPEGVEAETLARRSLWISETCKQKGYRFSPRLHIFLYGNVRGS